MYLEVQQNEYRTLSFARIRHACGSSYSSQALDATENARTLHNVGELMAQWAAARCMPSIYANHLPRSASFASKTAMSVLDKLPLLAPASTFTGSAAMSLFVFFCRASGTKSVSFAMMAG